MVLLVTLVMTGAALSTAAACGQQDHTPASAVQRTPIPAQGDGVSDSTQPDARPTAQKSRGSKVELDIFSGVPNPTWVLSIPEASDLTRRISRLDPTEAAGQRPDDLGYRGFIVQIAAGSSATARTIRARHGIVEVADSTGTAYYRDPQRQIELWLLATAHPSLDDRLTAEIVEEIVKDAPLTRSAD